MKDKEEAQIDSSIPSKSERKKVALELQDLGQHLTTFKVADLDLLPLPDQLRTAIAEFKRLPNAYGARKRQLQFIGKLMRDCDKDEISQAISKLSSVTDSSNKIDFHLQLSQSIFAEGDEAISRLVADHPSLNRQKLRQLNREFQKAENSNQEKIVKKIRDYLVANISPEN
ncbi:MAG: DUF615 domain-containing protein [Pseudomonadales bacterium]|nr:DUF615 domain-containing protein [Pseudomonadales bacterium]